MAIKDDTIKKLKGHYKYLSSEFGVKRIGLFGSVAARTDKEESDIDLIVEFKRPIGLQFINFVEYLETMLGRKVDVMTMDGIENIRVKKAAEEIRKTLIYV
jgi:hypothetical protein